MDEHHKHRASKESIGLSSEVAMIPEEDMGLLETIKMSDPKLVQSLLLLKNSTSSENQLQILLNRSKNMTRKYNELVQQLKTHGIDFILALGKRSGIGAFSREQESRLK